MSEHGISQNRCFESWTNKVSFSSKNHLFEVETSKSRFGSGYPFWVYFGSLLDLVILVRYLIEAGFGPILLIWKLEWSYLTSSFWGKGLFLLLLPVWVLA